MRLQIKYIDQKIIKRKYKKAKTVAVKSNVLKKTIKKLKSKKTYYVRVRAIKKTADCSKKGLGKDAMIEAMGRQIVDHHLISVLHDNPDYLKKKSNYVLCMDDIADSFWNLKTCMKDLNG